MGKYVIKEVGRGPGASYLVLFNDKLVKKCKTWLEVLRIVDEASYTLLRWGEY